MSTSRLFSGIQPSGIIHLGNYLGAIKQWLELTKKYDSIFCIVDLHALTVRQKSAELRKNTIELAKIYLALGLDPQKSTIFIQSQVSEHTELAWILNTLAKLPELERMTQFKDKSIAHKENINAGLFTYPVLMAADILLYDTAAVPVGEDQKQHVELARTLARRFNEYFGETFVIPESLIQKQGARIMGLDDPLKKMSKSAVSSFNFIALTDDAKTVEKKIARAVTDSGREVVSGSDKPALTNLLTIHSLLKNQTIAQSEKEFVGQGYADFKKALSLEINKFLQPIQKKISATDDKTVLKILFDGQSRAKKLAEKKMKEVKEKVGLI
ncbi:MAG TPA: tryptophan--tRNA ligase [Candidatus Magasanikbacteria bacterium]|uniref:Tryptophan--tRNA ligase n=1 Tax=Candidatus Magasanikbacteria bacterium GW2011_GWC2_41_17 TaxID=1619048 RepID=A0A0G0V8S7_9BACT|nr:MAG: Tryptophan-tRNA ligase [Candidatus Magasanikbacteria bacterium GW2011_GWC2_41_17]HBV57982.1 tryptophan--tRNA ligase [Candidatus Magasanikbacteria bacterium]HBX16430.1 tryptophan--tRNA ligase [Candidatus Magasanikbacteria bacterium]